jgi:hypothetical protein
MADKKDNGVHYWLLAIFILLSPQFFYYLLWLLEHFHKLGRL